MDRIELSGMSFQGRHGVRDSEREQAQEFRVDVEVEADLAAAGRSDRLEDTVDYTRIRGAAKDVIEGTPRRLIESLAADIARRVLELPSVAAVTVRVTKRPPSMEPIDGASVEIKRSRG